MMYNAMYGRPYIRPNNYYSDTVIVYSQAFWLPATDEWIPAQELANKEH